MTHVITKLVFDWDGNVLEKESYPYAGAWATLCGAPSGQKQLAQEQANYYQTLTNNANAEFGQASTLAQNFINEFTPIFNAGPNQQGWNAAESNAVNSDIVTTEGQATKNALQAAGATTNALGGGNEYVPQGATSAIKNSINVAGSQATAQSQQNALLANYQQGFTNFETAASGLEGVPSLYSGSTSAAGTATGAGSAANQSYNAIAEEEMSPLSLISSALGATGAALSGKA
jgi:hypothetical protein